MLFRYLGWTEAADLNVKGLNRAIASKRVTYDFARIDGRGNRDQMLRLWGQHHLPYVRCDWANGVDKAGLAAASGLENVEVASCARMGTFAHPIPGRFGCPG